MPLEAALGAVDPELEPVLGSRRGLGDPQDPARAVGVADQHPGGVVEPAPRHDRADIGRDRLRLRSGHRVQQVPGVGADVTEDRRRPGAARVKAPVIGVIQIGPHRELRLDVLDLAQAELADLAVRHHGPRLPDHGKGGIVVRRAEDEAARPYPGDEVAGVVQVGGERLVADDVLPRVEPAAGERVVAVVRGHDRDHVHPVRARRLGREHRVHVCVRALGRKAEGPPRRMGPFRIGGQHAADHLVAVVEARRGAMDLADDAAGPPADDSKAEPSA